MHERTLLLSLAIALGAGACALSPGAATTSPGPREAAAQTEDGAVRTDDLLPGWRAESIQLPPGFAPTLPAGSETLRFAPDAFVEGSETLWTYCFAASMEGDRATTEAVEDFFRVYFDGLSAAVAAGKGVTGLPPTTVRFQEVTPGGLVGTAQVFDSFVSLAPMELHLQVAAAFDGERTVLRVRATPRAWDDPIWSVLEGEVQRIDPLGPSGR